MELHGQVQNGAIVLDEGSPPLPDGQRVVVSAVPATRIVREPGRLPYVTGGEPGTWTLTNQMIEDIFEEEDLELVRRGGGAVPS